MSSAQPAASQTKAQKKKKGKKPAENTATPNGETTLAPPEASPIVAQGEAGENTVEKKDNEALREIIKREKKMKKKLNLIAISEGKIAGLKEDEIKTKINDDERRKIAEKPLFLAIHKEQTEIIALVEKLNQEAEARLSTETARLQEAQAKDVAEAKQRGHEEGKEAGRQVLWEVVRFLKAAAYKRAEVGSSGSPPTDEDNAMEAALIRVYDGDANAVDACEKLAAGAEEPVNEDSSVTWARIKQISNEMDAEDVAQEEESAAEHAPEAHEIASDGGAEVDSASTAHGEADDASITATVDTTVAPTVSSEPETLPTDSVASLPVMVETPVETPASTTVAENDTPQTGTSWGDEAHEAHEAEQGWVNIPPQNGNNVRPNGEFTESRGGRGGYRGRGDGHRGRGEYRGDRGNFRGRGGRGRGEYRGRGGYRGERGDFRGEGRGGNYRGAYRGNRNQNQGEGEASSNQE